MEEQAPANIVPEKRPFSRPLLLTVFCLFAFVYFGLISLLLLGAVIFSGWIAGLVNHYSPGPGTPPGLVTAAFLAAFLLHAACFTGAAWIWKLKKKGYYIYSVSALVIAFYQLFQPSVPFYSTLIPVALLLLFGVFFRRFS